MSRRTILLHPHPVLRQKAAALKEITKEDLKLLEDMIETMHGAPGIGLAAPQVGVSKRLLVMHVTRNDQEEEIAAPLYKMINPEIIQTSDALQAHEEGCLSLPGISAEVTRPSSVTVKYRDETGQEKILEATGLTAVCVQHEIDHLNGVLYVDHLSRLKKSSVLKKYKKLREAEADPHVL